MWGGTTSCLISCACMNPSMHVHRAACCLSLKQETEDRQEEKEERKEERRTDRRQRTDRRGKDRKETKRRVGPFSSC